MKRILVVLLIVSLILISCSLLAKTKSVGNDENGSSVNIETDFSKLTYCAYGDSITFGADYTNSYLQMSNPYPSLVGQELGLKSTTNRGVSGATLTQNDLGLVNMTELMTSRSDYFDIISVMGGVNDYARSLPLGSKEDTTNETIYGSLRIIASYFKRYYRNSFIFFMTPYKAKIHNQICYEPNDAGYTLKDVADAVKYVANQYNIPVLDLYNNGLYERYEMNSPSSDGVHPSQEFFINYTAPQIADFIRNNYKNSDNRGVK